MARIVFLLTGFFFAALALFRPHPPWLAGGGIEPVKTSQACPQFLQELA